ncbi:MAG TPA: tetratricopeptide repeat protein [Vicinamibacterales bacterium]|nr:tetratricopeptide repeat protein [Vicinamibacterales bacterium]
MRGRLLFAIVAVLALVAACAPKTAPVPVAGAPHFADFVEPVATGLAANSPLARQTRQAWLFLQSGDLRGADREISVVLKADPGFFPAQAVQAYVSLARKDERTAAAQFSKLTEGHPDYVPALVGKGLALVAGGQNAEAAAAFRAALALDPSLADVARRVEVLTLRGLQDELTAARQAARSGQPDAAIRAYRNAIAASPDSAFLYRELAALERQQGELPLAIEHLRRANELDPTDAQSYALLGDTLDQQGDSNGALRAYADSLALEPDARVEARRAALRARLDLAALPEQYRAIESSAQATRADLAALIAVRLPGLLQAAQVRDIGVLTDIRGSWAERYIAPVARAGIIEAFPNHTFQPRAVLRRVDLAQATARLLALVAAAQPARPAPWQGARGRFTDLNPGHLAYPAASMAVAAGVLVPGGDGSFQPTRVVSGGEAAEAIDRVRELAGPGAIPSDRR